MSEELSDYKRGLAEFAEAVDQRFHREQPESFWSCEPLLRDLVSKGFAQQAINNELRQLLHDPAYAGDWRPTQLVAHRGRGYALAIALLDGTRRYIHTSPFYAMYMPVGTAPLRCDLYRLPDNYSNEVFDANLRLQPLSSVSTAPGEVLLARPENRVFDFVVEQPQLIVMFTSAAFLPLEWLFSRDNLHAWHANDSELTATQMRVAAYVLGRLAHQSSLEPLKSLTTHPHHTVRWAAIQALGRLSRTEVIAALELARNDPHPHNRRAAERTLERLYGSRTSGN